MTARRLHNWLYNQITSFVSDYTSYNSFNFSFSLGFKKWKKIFFNTMQFVENN